MKNIGGLLVYFIWVQWLKSLRLQTRVTVITWVDGRVSDNISNHLLNLWSQACSLRIQWASSFHRLGQVHAHFSERQNPALSYPDLEKQEQSDQWSFKSVHCTVCKLKVWNLQVANVHWEITKHWTCIQNFHVYYFFKTSPIIHLQFYFLYLLYWIKQNHPTLVKNSFLIPF